jgi:RNA polymerase-binding protein DksA
MAPVKKTSGRKKTPARSSSSTKTSRRTAAKKTSAAKKTPKKTTAKKTAKRTAKKTAKTTAKKTPKKTAAKKTAKRTAKKTTAKRGTAKKPTAKKTAEKKTVNKPTRKATAGAPAARGGNAAAPKARPRARAVKFDKKQLAEIRQELESERGNLLAQLDELTADSFDGTQSDMTGEVGLDDDFADAGSATFERERDLSIQNNVRDLIDQMNRAIQRIEDGKYGTCERCGNPIEAARLKALPHALLCMDCKRREERAR